MIRLIVTIARDQLGNACLNADLQRPARYFVDEDELANQVVLAMIRRCLEQGIRLGGIQVRRIPPPQHPPEHTNPKEAHGDDPTP